MIDFETNAPTYEELREAYLKAIAEKKEMEAELLQVIKCIVRILGVVGLWPIKEGDNIMSKALKAMKNIMADSIFDSKGLEKKFDFIKEIYPLADKYKDLKFD